MYKVGVRDHMMIAHGFRGEMFGPAQKVHGATYVVDIEFSRRSLDADGVVVDIGAATQTLRALLARWNYTNLDDDPTFEGQNTTTEFMAKAVFDRMLDHIIAGDLGPGAQEVEHMKVRLGESHIAWGSYEGPVNARAQP